MTSSPHVLFMPIAWFLYHPTSFQLSSLHGPSADFTRGVFFPDDAAIDSPAYARGLLAAAQATGAFSFVLNHIYDLSVYISLMFIYIYIYACSA